MSKGKFAKILSIVLAMAMALTMVLPAFAASGDNKIVINAPKGEPGEGNRFTAYQIFKGTHDASKNQLTITGWGDSVDGSKLLQAMKESVSTVPDLGGNTTFGGQFTKAYGEYEKSYDSQLSVAEFVAQWLAKVSENYLSGLAVNPYADAFARLVPDNLKADPKGRESTKTTKEDDPGVQWTINLDEPGYYLVEDKYKYYEGQAASVSSYILSVAGDVQVNLKASIPTVDKEVVDDHGHMSEGAIYRPFEAITYTITGTVAKNIDEYDTYKYTFTDNLSKGLDLVKYEPDTGGKGKTATPITATAEGIDVKTAAGIKVYLYNNFLTKPTDLKTVTDAAKNSAQGSKELTGWTANYKTGVEGRKVLTVSFEDLKEAAGSDLKPTSYIVVVYAAMMNQDAVSGSEGNPNDVKLTYSNDPYHNGTGETAPDEPKVYTVGFNLAKVDGSNWDNPLEGASFKLKRWNWSEIEGEDGNGDEWNKVDGSFSGKTEWAITETVNNGAGEGIPKYVIKGWTDKEDSATEMATGTDGKMQIVGFRGFGVKHDAGTDHVYQANYALVETTVPEGYQKIEDLIFTVKITVDTKGNLSAAIIYRHDSNKNRQDVELNNDQHSMLNERALATLTVRNYKAPLLPFTGGIGTVIFYVAGVLLIAGAVTYLVITSRKRKKNEE